jgi:hypothetical protein
MYFIQLVTVGTTETSIFIHHVKIQSIFKILIRFLLNNCFTNDM